MAVDVLVRRKRQKYARRHDTVTLKVCEDLDHARNYVRKITEPDWYQGPRGRENLNDVTRVTVWLDDNHCTVWVKGKGWSPVREQQRRKR